MTTTASPQGVRPVPDADSPAVRFGSAPVAIEDIVAVARGTARAVLDDDADCRHRLRASSQMLGHRIAAGDTIYGVTTGFGESCVNVIPADAVAALPLNLMRFHGCGTGRILDEIEGAAIVAARVASLSRGYSAVREGLLEAMCDLLNHGVIPCIPAEGSVGASGDLTPLSYVAATLVGEREASFRGRTMPAAGALTEAGLAPLTLAPKEALALMNGTSVMTALASLAFDRTARLARFAAALTGTLSDVLKGNRAHFHPRIFQLKPHPGQALVACWIREDIEYAGGDHVHDGRIQDRYSIRCAPHVIGLLVDHMIAVRPMLEVELNSVNDNPILDPEQDLILHGGNFYGGHVCLVMDGMKSTIASVADLMDRQMVLLCNPMTNNGLPADLVGATGEYRTLHHGFKAMQIATSALAAEALKLTMPAAAFSRSTESHNQDKVSMGTIAARDCLRTLDLTEQIAAILLLAAVQAVDLRRADGCHLRGLALRDAVRRFVPFNDGDRRQDLDIAAVLDRYRAGGLPLGEAYDLATVTPA